MKPILACDYDESAVVFPMIASPKIDGVRAMHNGTQLVGRRGKPFKNKLVHERFDRSEFHFMDGEMVAGEPTSSSACRDTTSALGSILGSIPTKFYVFDYFHPDVVDLPYDARMLTLSKVLDGLEDQCPELAANVSMVPSIVVRSCNDVDRFYRNVTNLGYEGVILRSLGGPYKNGRCTVREGYYLRVKEFRTSELIVTGIIEGKSNHNPEKRDPNGKMDRSTKSEYMVPNGLVGAILGTSTKDIYEEGRLIVSKGEEIKISPGKMNHSLRRLYHNNRSHITGRIATFKYFPKGCKGKLRQPTFQHFRDPIDMDPEAL